MRHMSPASLPEPQRVSWSPAAIRELKRIRDRSVQEDLKRNAEETLHEIPERGDEYRQDHSDEYREDRSDEYREDHSADEGRVGEIMWHRGWTHEQERQAERELEESTDDGPWNYFLIYRRVPGRRRSRSWPSAAFIRWPTAGGRWETRTGRALT